MAPATGGTVPEPGSKGIRPMTTSKATAPTIRVQRGIALHRERGHEITRTAAHTYSVPSCTGDGHYLVYLDLRACTCPDHARAKDKGERCKHYHAAYIFAAKRRAARDRRSA